MKETSEMDFQLINHNALDSTYVALFSYATIFSTKLNLNAVNSLNTKEAYQAWR